MASGPEHHILEEMHSLSYETLGTKFIESNFQMSSDIALIFNFSKFDLSIIKVAFKDCN
jgi:hypothetical protein